MELKINLDELLELKNALIQKKQNINITADKSINNLLNKESLKTIDVLLNKINKLLN